MAGSVASGPSRAARRTIEVVFEIEGDGQSLTVLPADEAARRARPLPSDDELALDLTDAEWEAFEGALQNR